MSTVRALSPRTKGTKRRRKAEPVKIFSFITLVVTTFLMLLPLFFMVSTSLKSKREMLKFPPTFLRRAGGGAITQKYLILCSSVHFIKTV